MPYLANIWKHPRTSVSGLLIAVVTVGGVLSGQGVGLGKVGTGTEVSLASALATALLGLMAKDPGEREQGGSAKLGAWVLIALLVPLPWMEGCTGTRVAQEIVNWTPALESAVTTVDTTVALLAPADAPALAEAAKDLDALANALTAQAKAYLANPAANGLAQLQSQIVLLQQQVNTALLSAARIVNPASQQHALAALQAVATITAAILALVQSVSSRAEVARMAADSPVKLAAVERYLDQERAAGMVAAHSGETVNVARAQVAEAERAMVQAGF